MTDHSTSIIAGYLLLGALLSLVLRGAVRGQKAWAVGVGSPVLALMLAVGAAFGAGFTQELCQKRLQLCLATSDSNVWNFVVYPLLCIPLYWLIISVGRKSR